MMSRIVASSSFAPDGNTRPRFRFDSFSNQYERLLMSPVLQKCFDHRLDRRVDTIDRVRRRDAPNCSRIGQMTTRDQRGAYLSLQFAQVIDD